MQNLVRKKTPQARIRLNTVIFSKAVYKKDAFQRIYILMKLKRFYKSPQINESMPTRPCREFISQMM